MLTKPLQQKLKSLPKNPGVYLFKNTKGEILYVGKAKILKNRVRSYFTASHDEATLPAGRQARTQTLVANIADFEYIICDTEAEALMLENNLIKKHLPHYNILLRDDKNFQFIMIDYGSQIPQIRTIRKIPETSARRISNFQIPITKNQKRLPTTNYGLRTNKYFGPYTSGQAVRQTLQLLRYVIPFCGNKKITSRPCFYYHLGRCPGVCFGAVTLEKYNETLKAVGRFLKGDFANIQKNLKGQMKIAARQKKFERAAKLRDQIFALEKMLERQKIMSTKRESFDTVSVFSAGSLAAVNLFQIREGRLIGKENFILENAKDKDTDEILRSFLTRYYLETSDIPDQINIPHLTPSLSQLGEGARRVDEVRDFKKKKNFITDINQLGKILSNKSGKNIKFLSPSRGRKRKLLKLGETNARDFLEKSSQNQAKEQAQLTRALFELQDKLRLPTLPLRIEAFDISNIQGTLPTGSMVVFENGKPKKTDYKRFAIKSLSTPNDVGMMREMLSRRLSHSDRGEKSQISNDKFQTNSKSKIPISKQELESWRLPDLIVADGGRAQLNTALSVLKSKKLKIPVMGLAKRLEEIYLPQLKSPLRLPANSAALYLLQRVRDEAHRFAIAYHRKKRTKRMLE